MKIQDKVCVVTGGSNGLGRELVDNLLQRKAIVIALDIVEGGCADLIQSLPVDRFTYIKCNVADEKSIVDTFEQIIAKHNSIHVVVNCAGIAPAERIVSKNGEAHSLDSFKRVIDVNLTGSFNVLRVAATIMSKQDVITDEEDTPERGVIINVASVAAYEGQIGQAAYAASKGGICSLTLPASRELARFGIRVLAIAPGIFMTPMLKKLPEKVVKALNSSVPFPSRVGNPEEFSRLVCHIIDNAYLNGTVIRLDGSIRMAAM